MEENIHSPKLQHGRNLSHKISKNESYIEDKIHSSQIDKKQLIKKIIQKGLKDQIF